MVTILPVPRALVPVDSAAAERISARNYDEFQGDREVFDAIRARPDCILRVTMAHCAVETPEGILRQDSDEALERAVTNLRDLREGGLTRTVEDVLFVYAIDDPHRGARQVGLGGMVPTRDIRSEERPAGVIVRNEGIREEKARGRARLIQRTRAFSGVVNHAVEDRDGTLRRALDAHADAASEDFRATDERGCVHRVWLVSPGPMAAALRQRLAAEPLAYVADGNHRSAAAAMLDLDAYLGVFFPAATMGLAPYNRLVEAPRPPLPALLARAEESFETERLEGVKAFQPATTHEIGLYGEEAWHRLTPRPGTYDPGNPVETVDADIVQRRLFRDALGIQDPRDERLTFVGGDRDAGYLRARVDSGEFGWAVTLPPVTMAQFIAVCRAGQIMPPKSTWFQPKLRMGLVMALL